MAAIAIAVTLAASCGSADNFDGDLVSSTSSEGTGSSSEDVLTDDAEQQPIATTAPISSDPDLDGGADTPDEPQSAEQSAEPEPQATVIDEEAARQQLEAMDQGDVAPPTVPAEPAPTGGLSRTFGGNDTVCRSVIVQPTTGEAGLQEAKDCLLAEIAAGRPIVVDFAVVSTEGQPIYFRYAYDGNQILVVNDSRLDSFGSQTIIAQLCDSVLPGPIVPLPSGCTAATSSGIAEADG